MTRARSPIRFGIVGCGGAAAAVAMAIDATDGAVVGAVHDRLPERARALAAPRGATVHRHLRALLSDDGLDVVYVALPHDRLASTTIAALRAGRHVLVEKPVATRQNDIDRIRVAAATAGRSVGVAFELRFVPAVQEAARLVRSGALGRLRAIRIRTLIDKPTSYWAAGPTGLVADPWRASRRRAGGGVVLMNTIHQLDLIRLLTGLRVERAAGFAIDGVEGVDVEDVAVAALELEGGVLAGIDAAAHAPGAVDGETIEIDGNTGSLRLGDPYAAQPRLDAFLREPALGLATGRWLDLSPPPADPWPAAIEAFVDAIAAGRPPIPGLDDAEAALGTVLAIYRSARTGRIVRVAAAPATEPATLPRATRTAARGGPS